MGSDSYFTILGVGEDIGGKELKSAFMKMVRKHPPHKDPEMYKKLRQAFDCLNSPVERQRYVANLHSGGQISALQEQISTAFVEEKWDDAISLSKRVIVIDADNVSARNQLALAQLNSGDLKNADRTLQKLNSFDHGDPLYFCNHGFVLRELSSETDDKSYLSKAESAYKKAVALDSTSSQGHIGLAQVCFGRQDTAAGISYCRQAIDADGEVDFQDFEAYFLMCQYLAADGNNSKFKSSVREVESILTEDVCEYASGLFAQFALEVYRHSKNVVMAKLFSDAAMKFLSAFGKSDSELKELSDSIRNLDKLRAEHQKIEDDESILLVVRQFVSSRYYWNIDELSEEQYREIFKNCLDALDTWSVDEVEFSFKKVKRICPRYYSEMKELVDSVLESCRSAQGATKTTTKRSRGSSSRRSTGSSTTKKGIAGLSQEEDRLSRQSSGSSTTKRHQGATKTTTKRSRGSSSRQSSGSSTTKRHQGTWPCGHEKSTGATRCWICENSSYQNQHQNQHQNTGCLIFITIGIFVYLSFVS
jgi:tetratricopeptide (TPR) repeat protein